LDADALFGTSAFRIVDPEGEDVYDERFDTIRALEEFFMTTRLCRLTAGQAIVRSLARQCVDRDDAASRT